VPLKLRPYGAILIRLLLLLLSCQHISETSLSSQSLVLVPASKMPRGNDQHEKQKKIEDDKHFEGKHAKWKKALRETQTLRAGCRKAEPKIFCPTAN